MSRASAPRLIVSAIAFAFSLSFASADEFGVATYYYNPRHAGLIAAHLRLPFGTRVRVYNLDNGRDVVVTILDRGRRRFGDAPGGRRAGPTRGHVKRCSI